MRFRRVRTDDGLEYEVLDEARGWVRRAGFAPLGPSPYDAAWEVARADEQLRFADACLPFQPLSFRDFLLHEQHNIDASRGLVRRFHPRQYRLTTAVEAITRRPFPRFRPKPLFYRQPVYYLSNSLTFVPSGTPISAPSYSRALDYELELGFVLKSPLFNATPDDALQAIGAFVVLNDLSARDVQRAEMESLFGPQKCKHFASSMSEIAATPEEILPRVGKLTGTVQMNGTVVSTVSDAGMRWSLGEVLAHASREERLYPGELFATGTLPGGSGIETGNWVHPGDTITLTIDGIGEIRHEVVA
jgi:2-keto-4-pentenoate hydratase/2-oxohepta-3-ene-1,7-dioic acid hydratase in catechol pathway